MKMPYYVRIGSQKEDVLLKEVAKRLEALATCYLEMSSSTQQMFRPYMERLLLLQWRSKDVVSEFSTYYCFRLLVDNESPLATFFIDLFHELEWLLGAMDSKAQEITRGGSSSSPIGEDSSSLYNFKLKICELGCSLIPAVDSCRHLFAISRFSPSVCSQWLSTGKEMKREGKCHRDFSMDDFRCLTKMLSFVNLDQSIYNKVELRKMLGSGGYADVYEGHFVTRNHTYRPLRIIGEPVAVKVFRYDDCTESAGPSRSIGFQFFDQMEKMVELQNMKTNGHNTSSMSAGEKLLSEELWKLVSAKHPNIVTARGYIGNRPQGESGLVMQLMDTSLQEHLEKVKEPLEELEMIDLMLEIAKGMRFLHECELVHKDLKPRNILLRSHKKLWWGKYPAMEVKLADFGLTQYFVQDVQQSAVDTSPAGTYCYMAPEVLHMSADYKTSYQDKVDVFSYGTTCFNILTCEIPNALEFTCASSKAKSAEFYEAVKSSVWREGVEGKPEYLIDLIARCWDFDPSRRPSFATICSLLQRAMLCILSPPVINVTTLSYFPHNSIPELWELYERIRMSLKFRRVIGTRMMESCLEELEGDLRECPHMRSNLSEDVTLFVEAWNKIRGPAGVSGSWPLVNSHILKCGEAAREQLFAAMSLKQSEATSWEELFAAIDDEANVDVDGSNSVTTPVVRVQVEEPDRFWRIPLKTMDPQWVLYKALVYNSMVDFFYYRLDVTEEGTLLLPFRGGGVTVKKTPLPFRGGGVMVDETLLPFLVCFWEGRAPLTSRNIGVLKQFPFLFS